MPPSPHIVFLGAASMDMIFSVETLPVGAGKILPRGLVQAAHGMATSAAAAVARLGGRASLITRIGDDIMGDRFLAEISAEGVDCRHVRRFEGVPTPLSAVIVDDAGERLILPYYDRALGNDPGWIPADFIQQADAIQVDIRWPEGAMRALKLAREAERLAVLDADTGPTQTIVALADEASHTVFSEPAALQVSGASTIPEALPLLAQRFAGFVAITGGPLGCFWMEDGAIHQALPPNIRAVDTLAAGDVFHGAFTLALAEGQPIREAIIFANAAAAIKCASFGGRLGAPNRTAVEELLGQSTVRAAVQSRPQKRRDSPAAD